VAAAQLGGTQIPISLTPIDQTGELILIGALTLPPDINNPDLSLQAEEGWHDGFRSLLRDRGFLRHDAGNVFKIAGAGWQVIDRLKASEKKTSEGVSVWEGITKCLSDLASASLN
jgi:hypothetical protein